MKHKLSRNKKSFRKTLKKHKKSRFSKKSRLSKKSRFSKKNKKHNGRKITRRYRKKLAQKGGNNNIGFGGENAAINNPPPPPSNGAAAVQKLLDNAEAQNKANGMVGGSSCGIPCCNSDTDYGYGCPPGKCGPIPQTGSESSDNLIEQAARISASSVSNAEFDSLVETQ